MLLVGFDFVCVLVVGVAVLAFFIFFVSPQTEQRRRRLIEDREKNMFFQDQVFERVIHLIIIS